MLIAWPKVAVIGKVSWRRLDLIGCLLCLVASVLLVFALQQAGAGVYSWSNAVVIASITVAGVAAIALCYWIRYLSTGSRPFEPLFPARIIVHRVMATNIV